MTRIELTRPVDFAGEVVTHLQLDDVRAEHLWDMEPGSLTVGQLLEVAGRAAGQPPAVMRMLSAPDALRVAQEVGGFFGGEDSSPETPAS